MAEIGSDARAGRGPAQDQKQTAADGETVEFAAAQPHGAGDAEKSAQTPQAAQSAQAAPTAPTAQLPAARSDLREFLPGLEPERHVTDWGRSERIETIVDRTVYDFLYRHWFRVETEGIENIPIEGGALLVANHAGAIPPDGIMIAKAVREEHPLARPVHLAVDRSFKAIPAVGAFGTKIGAVSAHPADVHRLLFDEGQLVLAFPEGSSGARKPLKERYRVRRFGPHPWFVEAAIRARVPIVPVAIIGAEEAQPVFARIPLVKRLTRLSSVPITPLVPLPAKFKIRFLEAVSTTELAAADPVPDRALQQTLSHDIRALIQENLLEMVAARRSVWLG
jgi:1-acyl-sn-glycerol-3-phosphate acyltransferase